MCKSNNLTASYNCLSRKRVASEQKEGLGEDLADLLFLKVHCIKCKVVPQILLMVFESSAIGTI